MIKLSIDGMEGTMKRSLTKTAIAAAMGLAIVSIATTASAAPQVTYTYDALGRLATAVYSNGKTIVYSYDKAGNRTSTVIVTTAKWGSFTWGSASWG